MIKIAPSILSADFAYLADEIKKVTDAGAEYIHLDIMDGQFVPNITFGSPVVAALRKTTKAVFDVHLMVEQPENQIEQCHHYEYGTVYHYYLGQQRAVSECL